MRKLATSIGCRVLFAAAVADIAWPAFAHGVIPLHGPHTHGIGDLQVHRAGTAVEMLLVLSAQDVVGFEHAATTVQEKAALRDAAGVLERPLSLFETPCGATDVEIEALLFDRLAHGTDATQDSAIEHSDFAMKYRFDCRGVAHFKAEVFTLFPSLTALRVHAPTDHAGAANTILDRAHTEFSP